jgi:hypothetical protein
VLGDLLEAQAVRSRAEEEKYLQRAVDRHVGGHGD